MTAPLRSCRPLQLLLGCLFLSNLPLMIKHLQGMWGQAQYQYFPIVLVAVGWLVSQRIRWRSVPLTARWPSWCAVPLLVFSVLLSLLATVLHSPWIATASTILGIGAVMLLLHNYVALRNGLGIWMLLFLVLRPPLSLDMQLANRLQLITTSVSGTLLDIAHIPNIVEGNILVLPSRRLFVEQACSGIVSLMTIIAASMILAVINNRRLFHTFVLTASGAAWAAMLNILRIVTLSLALQVVDVDLTSGWRHDILGLVLFAATVGFVVCTDYFLLFLLGRINGRQKASGYSYRRKQRLPFLIRMWNLAVSPGQVFEPGESQPSEVITPLKVVVPYRRLTAAMSVVLLMNLGSQIVIATRLGSVFTAALFTPDVPLTKCDSKTLSRSTNRCDGARLRATTNAYRISSFQWHSSNAAGMSSARSKLI